MPFENTFYKFFTKDVYITQDIDFLENEIDTVNEVLSKKYLSQKETDLLCCILSSLIYRYDRGLDWLKVNIYDYELYKKDNGLVYGIFYINDKIYIAFKGSSTVEDFIKDANIVLLESKYFPGKVHAGFGDFLLSNKVYREIFKNMKKFMDKYSPNEIYLTGHSLGGALSSLFYSMCKRYKYFNKEFSFSNITFGSPRVGNADFCKDLQTKRIVNKKDIVTMLPFPICYRHLNTVFKLEYKWGFPSIIDHDINKYYQNLKAKTL